MKNKLIYSIIATLLISFSAHADIVCVKKKVKVVNEKVKIARAIVRLGDTEVCPPGYQLVADESNFIQREEFDQTIALLPDIEETKELVNRVEKFTEIIGDEESGFTKQIHDLDDAINNPVTGLATKASEADLTTLANTVNNAETGLAAKANQADLTTLANTVNNAETGLATKASQAALTTLANTVNNTETGLATKASQADLTTLANAVNNTETGLATKASQADLTTLANTVNDAETGLATKASQAALTTLANAVNDAETGLASKASQADLTTLANTVNNTETGLATKASEANLTTLANTVNNAETGLATKASQASLNSATTRISALETTVGSATSGIVKNVADLTTVVGDSESGLVKDINTLSTTIGDTENGLVKDVADLTTIVGDASSGLVKDVADLQAAAGNYQSWDQVQIPYGKSVSGIVEIEATGTDLVVLPVAARKPIATTDIIIDDGTDGDECEGDAANPVAPAGKVCVYVFEGDRNEVTRSGLDDNDACSTIDDEGHCTGTCTWTAPATVCTGNATGCAEEAVSTNCDTHTEGGTCEASVGTCSSADGLSRPINRAFRLSNADTAKSVSATWVYQEEEEPQP